MIGSRTALSLCVDVFGRLSARSNSWLMRACVCGDRKGESFTEAFVT